MTYTLAADGPSDKVLLPLITWSLKRYGVTAVSEQWADFSRIRTRPRLLRERLDLAIDLYPCDVLFVHRDAETQDPALRREEINKAVADISVRHVPVVPVRMTEAWLLGHQGAIRSAAGNPNGTDDLSLPEIRKCEHVPDPKATLHEALAKASGLGSRRRLRLSVERRAARIPSYIDDYAFLDSLPSFAALQRDIGTLLEGLASGQ